MLCNNLDIGGFLKFRLICVLYLYIYNKLKFILLIFVFFISILLGVNFVINGDIFLKNNNFI